MRNIDEQLKAIELRAEEVKRQKAHKDLVMMQAGLMAVCVALIMALPFVLHTAGFRSELPVTHIYGSIVSTNSYLSYIVIGIISFMLGITFTMLCLQVSRKKGRRK